MGKARDNKAKTKKNERQERSRANTIGTRLPSAEEVAETTSATNETTIKIDLLEVIDIMETLTPRQKQALEDMNMEKLIANPNIPFQSIVDLVANLTDGRFDGTRLNREQVR